MSQHPPQQVGNEQYLRWVFVGKPCHAVPHELEEFDNHARFPRSDILWGQGSSHKAWPSLPSVGPVPTVLLPKHFTPSRYDNRSGGLDLDVLIKR